MACPVLLASRSLAVLALQSDLSHGVYDEEDLRFLVLLAQSLAPALYALKSIEQLRRDNELLRGSAAEPLRILGNSRAIRHVRALVARAAKSVLNVLVLGETGTGKELAARSIHILSPRRTRPLVVVNCAAIPRDLFESEVFGHVKGAFTGAVEPSEGLLAQASGGTLFLDEVGDLSLENQARLLRAVDTGTFRQVGAKQESRVDIRVVAATNMDIAAAVREGSFRKDLYHRLNGFEIQIPPLRERPSDIPILAQHFFDLGRNRAKRPLRGMTPESLAYLASRSWPGNVRELRNVVERGIASTTRDVLMPQNLIESRSDSSPEPTGEELTLESVQLRHIAEILRQCGGNVPQAARILQISRSSLYAKIAEYGLQV
ncbi:MAG: sigma-54-dependent Fis family transcriptional regulator [Candidatus Hydrogenedentes bacterium]|nr:sigma-54-dependent Fis family transcriptional regulator [Candidatus Hydrogenedentota bacterium]